MKEPDLTLRGRASISRSLSPVSNRDALVMSPSAAKARGLREARKLSWEGYESLIKARTDEDLGRLSVSPPADRSASPPPHRRRTSRFSSRSASPVLSPSRGPSPDSPNGGATAPAEPAPPTQPPPQQQPQKAAQPPPKRQSLQALTSVEINGRFSAPPDLYSFPRSKSNVRFSRSLPKLPDELPGFRQSASPVDRRESSPSPVPPLGTGQARPARGWGGERRSFFGGDYLNGDAHVQEDHEPLIKVTFTPRVPGDEAWRDDDEIKEPRTPVERLDGEGLAFKIPQYLAGLRGTSQEGERPALGPRLSNIAGVQVVGSHRRSTFIRAVEAITGLGATILAPSTEKVTSKYVTTAAKRNSTVIVPVSAKQWLLQSLRMKDWELRELFDQMEMIPQLAADHVREVRAEWESLEARAMKVPPEADMLLKDQQLLDKTKTLLRRFITVLTEDAVEEEQQQQLGSPQETPDMDMGTAMPEHEGFSVDEYQTPQPQTRESILSSPADNRNLTSPSPFGQIDESISADLYVRKPFIGKPVCPTCKRVDGTAPNTRIMGGMLPRESTLQSRGPSPVPRASLPSFIPFEDYVIRQSVVKPSGKLDKFKTTYSPLEKRWYTVLFPALQPGKREDVSLLSEWLCHATQRNGVEDPDGHFKDVETAFVLHSIAFLEVVRQVRIHCEERGDMILHVWRQLLRIFNQVMQRAEPKLNAVEDEVSKVKELRARDKSDHLQTVKAMEELKVKLKGTEDNLQKAQYEIIKYRRCRLCLAGNMTPRTRESFVRKAMLKRFVGANFGSDGREKTRAEILHETLAETLSEAKDADEGKDTPNMPTDPASNRRKSAYPIAPEEKESTPQVQQQPAQSEQQSQVKPNTVITFLRAALLKRSHRPTLDEAANQQIQNELNAYATRGQAKPMEDKIVQTDDVTITEVSSYAKVLKRSASCPARMFYKEIVDSQKAARHKQWLIDNGMMPEKTDRKADDDEVEIVVASSAAEEVGSEGQDGSTSEDPKSTDSKMKKHVNRLASETMDMLGMIGDELGLEGDAASKVAALMKKWKKVAKASAAFPMPHQPSRESEPDDGEEPFTWDDGDEGDGDDESAGGRDKRRRRSKAKGRKDSQDVEGPYQSRKSQFDIAADVLKRSKRSTGRYTMGQPIELGKVVPLGFAKMMDISKPPKDIKYFNDRQLTKIITAVYTAKVEADSLDDAAGGDRQSSCEFVYDFMLNLYGLKRLAESAVWGLFKKIFSLRTKKEIDKCHKARIFNRFCGMDETKYYSERELYLYLKLMVKGNATSGLFYPSELDDGISFVNCVWVEALASEPTLISYLGSQAIALDLIQKFTATHATWDKVSAEVKKITKAEKVKRIDFDELMEAIFEKGPADTEVVQIPRKPKKGTTAKAPLTAEQRIALEDLFVAGDANQDGVLTFLEFREIINSANPAMSKQDALRIFRETLLLEPEGGDKISPAAFATVAHKHDITAPPKVIFDLLKKTWLQIQADVNENKIKDEAARKESNELRTKVATLIETATNVNGAVQAFKEYVLKFCGEDQGKEEEDEEGQERETEEGIQENVLETIPADEEEGEEGQTDMEEELKEESPQEESTAT